MSNNTIKLAFSGIPGVEIEGIVETGETILPGMLITQLPAGTYVPYSASATEQKPVPILVAVENPYSGNYGTKQIDTPYNAGDRVYLVNHRPGDVMYMFLEDGAVSIGDYLTRPATTPGYLNEPVGGASVALGSAYEAADASGGPVRVKVVIS